MATLQEQIDFVQGPQVPITDSWLDRTLIAKARQHGEACPADPPADTDNTPIPDGNLTTSFNNLHYYDLPLSLYITHRRTGDPVFLSLARKAADSWWKHPTWIDEGRLRFWQEGTATPPPRHAGIGGLILRAMDGRPEMWQWIVDYTQVHLNIWCKSRINNSQLWYGPREVALSMQYAAWVAVCLLDSYPNAAQIRAQLIADLENLVVNYTGRLQYPDGSWRDSSEWVDADGGTMVNSMQPFIVGLLTSALVDVHQVVTTTAAKESAKDQILKACRHLYSDGPYAKDLIEQKSGVRVRGFHYFYHGGTTVNPTKYEKGDMVAPWTDLEGWWLSSARQAISTILPAFGYAFKLSGDQFYKDAASEMYDSAYSGGDGYRSFITDTAKNYNQHARRVGSLQAWLGGAVSLPTTPLPTEPTPPTQPEPTITESPNGFKGTTIVDDKLATWTIGGEDRVLRDGAQVSGGRGTEYKYLDKVVHVWGDVEQQDPKLRNWYKWVGSWVSVGPIEPGAPTPQPEPPKPEPTPEPVPPPAPLPAPRTVRWPNGLTDQMLLIQTQGQESYRPSGKVLPRPANMPKGSYVEFVGFK